MFDA